MIETFYSLGQLDGPKALFMSAVIGICFGIILEQAGFGSSRRLSGVFYFKDMAVIKVMFTAMITAIIGLQLSFRTGLISEQAIYLNPTLYTAHIIGGVLFGIGFVMGGWCPGTAAVGAASGKWDAFVFLGGALIGSTLFNETYPLVQGYHSDQVRHLSFVYDFLGMDREWFVLFFVAAGIFVFWAMELIEKKTVQKGAYLNSDFLKQFSFILLIAGFFIFIISGTLPNPEKDPSVTLNQSENLILKSEQTLLSDVDQAQDHMEPEDLAARIMQGQKNLVLVDIRPKNEFLKFHIKTALNIALKDLVSQVSPYKNQGMIILYSNGMTHPAQARDALSRMGFGNVYLLTDGLKGFVERCLKPASLRSEPVPESAVMQINQWRNFFLSDNKAAVGIKTPGSSASDQIGLPGMIDSQWLLKHLTEVGIRIIDLRSQPEYNTAHIPGSFALNIESFRGNIKGVPSCLLPAPQLAGHLSLMGILSETTVILVHGDKVQDATLAGMALERLGHKNYGILSGGFADWKGSGMKTDTGLPETTLSSYPDEDKDRFSVDYQSVLSFVTSQKKGIILDVRPAAYYAGEKSDEARAGHIPGALNRPYDMDTQKTGDLIVFKALPELEAAYEKIIPSKQSPVIVHCRTGHQASQTFFVLKHLLGYEQILWYDAGWTQWSAMPELPVTKGAAP